MDLSVNRAAVAMPGVFAQVHLPLPTAPFVRIGFARSFWNDLRTARGDVGVRWSEATLTACSDLFHQETVGAGPCLDAEAGRLEAVVVAPLPALARATEWFSAGVAGRLAWRPLGSLSLEVMGGVRVPLVRAQLLFEPAALVYDPPIVVPFLSTAVVAHLP